MYKCLPDPLLGADTSNVPAGFYRCTQAGSNGPEGRSCDDE
jgi:hypothetical protein